MAFILQDKWEVCVGIEIEKHIFLKVIHLVNFIINLVFLR